MAMMADMDPDSVDTCYVIKHLKKEMTGTDVLTKPSQEQDFKMSMIKIEKIDVDESYAKQSENGAQTSNMNLGHYQETVTELKMTHLTERDNSPGHTHGSEVSQSQVTELKMTHLTESDNSPGHTHGSEVSQNQVEMIKREKEIDSEKNILTDDKQEEEIYSKLYQQTFGQRSMMADTEHELTLDLNKVKKEKEETDEEQDFKMPEIKSEKIDEDESDLNIQQSENFAELAF